MIPPTPIIGIVPLLFLWINLITSFDLSAIGFPLKPPLCSLRKLDEFKFFLESVVLVAIIPSTEVSFTTSMISKSSSFDKSGAIFNKIGFF
jgi:hypothetical protein